MKTELIYALIGGVYFFINGIIFHNFFMEDIKDRKYSWYIVPQITIASFLFILPLYLLAIISGFIWYKVLKVFWNFFELGFIFEYYVFKNSGWLKKDLRVNENINETVFERDGVMPYRQSLVFIILKNELLSKSKNPLKKLKAKIQSACMKSVCEKNKFTPRKDKDYRVFLRGGPLNETPKGIWNGELYIGRGFGMFKIKEGEISR